MKAESACIMQVVVLAFLRSKVTILKPTASGMASSSDSSQMATISTTVAMGTPTPCTRDQDATARYLGPKGGRCYLGVVETPADEHEDRRHRAQRHLSKLRAQRLSTVMPSDAF